MSDTEDSLSAGPAKVTNYGEEGIESSSSSDIDSESIESSSLEAPPMDLHDLPDEFDDVTGDPTIPPRTKNELPEAIDMYIVEDLIVGDQDELQLCGTIMYIIPIEQTIVVQSIPNQAPLDVLSLLCDGDRRAIGKICDIFGPVGNPFYVVKYNAANASVEYNIGQDIFSVVPQSVFVTPTTLAQLTTMRGSDASNLYDEEVPVEEQDFSDDEAEQRAKQRNKSKRTGASDAATETAKKQSNAKPRAVRSSSNPLLPRPTQYAPMYPPPSMHFQQPPMIMQPYPEQMMYSPYPPPRSMYTQPQQYSQPLPYGAMMPTQQFSSSNYIPGVGFVQYGAQMPPYAMPHHSPYQGAYYPPVQGQPTYQPAGQEYQQQQHGAGGGGGGQNSNGAPGGLHYQQPR